MVVYHEEKYHVIHHGCQMAIAKFLDRMCLALLASGLWLRFTTLKNLIPSFPWIAPPCPPPRRNPRKGRDQILPSGNTATRVIFFQAVRRGRGQLHHRPDGARHLRRGQPRDQRGSIHPGAPLQGRIRAWLPDGCSQILRLYVFGHSGMKDYGSATLCCKM